jgi:hypothetical protein
LGALLNKEDYCYFQGISLFGNWVPYWTRRITVIYKEFGCLEIGCPIGPGRSLLFPRNLVILKLGALLNKGDYCYFQGISLFGNWVPYWTRRIIVGRFEIGCPIGRGGILLVPRNFVVWKLGALLDKEE